MIKRLISALCCLIILFIINLDKAVEGSNKDIKSYADSLFIAGVNYYNDGRYLRAYEAFSNLAFENASSVLREYSLFMQGQSLYEMGDYNNSIIVLRKFLRSYPSDRLRASCLYLLGNNYYKMNLFEQALKEYLTIFDIEEQSALSMKAVTNALNLFSEDLEIRDLENIKTEFDNPDIHYILDIKIASKYIKSGELNTAEGLLNKILQSGKKKFYYNQALMLWRYINELRERGVVIGLILPLEGEFTNLGKGIYEGAELAREEFNEKHKRKVNFLIEDSKGDPIEGVMAVKRLMENEFMIGILGPVDENTCVPVSVEAKYKRVPVIFPLTSNSGFSSMGEYVFQVNADYFTHVKSIAEYAIKELGLKTFAILAPISRSGQEIDEYFKEIIDKNGGTIVSEQGYFPGAMDLAMQFENIRNQGFEIMFLDSLQAVSDSIKISIFDEEGIQDFQSEFFLRKKLEISEKIDSNAKIDSLDISVTSIDGLFLPVEKEDLKVVVSQFPFYNITTQVLGGTKWYNPTVVESDINYIDNMIFTSDYFIEESNILFSEFISKFRLKYGRTPSLPEVYGYDCTSLFLDAIERGASTREDLRDELSQIENFQGIKGKISFDKSSRMNEFVKVLKYYDGEIVELQ